MHSPSRKRPDDFLDLDLDDFGEEPMPDSSVRPTMPPPSARARLEGGTRNVNLSIRVARALLGAGGSGYVTVTTPEGEVLFEGEVLEGAALELCLGVKNAVTHLKAMLEAGTKYRNANVVLSDASSTEYTFA